MSNIDNIDFENMRERFKIIKSNINRNLTYCVIEDLNNKQYIFIDLTKEDWRPEFIPFGIYFAEVANCFIDSDENAVYHNTVLERKEIAKQIDSMKRCKSAMEELLSLIRNIDKLKNKYKDDKGLTAALLREWKKYRYISISDVYHHAYSYLEGYSDEFKQRSEELGELENILSLEKDGAEFFWETLEHIHCTIKSCYFIPYDDVYIYVPQIGEWITGQAWFCTKDTDYIVSRELYHLLVDNLVEAPRFCPRCNHLFYSNNKKTKYCPNCKENYKEIRNNARKANEVGYLHKRIYDKINCTKRYDSNDLDKFVVESNFYRDIVRGKESATPAEPWYDLNITTKEQYQAWLEKKLEEYSYHSHKKK